MSRLIDADCLNFEGQHYNNSQMKAILDFIDAQPTAYDPDKVVDDLEKNGQKMSEAKSNKPFGKASPSCHNYYKAISVKKAIEIVKGGGVDE